MAWNIVSRRHRDIPLQHDWRTFLWADQAGYFVYLPAHFIYDWDARNMPADIDAGTGLGFKTDRNSGKILTKYPIGSAWMQSPFFLVAHAWVLVTGAEASGFSLPYIISVMIAGITWGCAGLFWLWGFLRRKVGEGIALLTTISFWLGGGIIYYQSENAGMSHIYAFALFALLLNFLDRHSFFRSRNAVFTGVLIGLIFLVRPTGLIGVGGILLWVLVDQRVSVSELLKKPLWMIFICVSAFLVLLPQMAYWRYAHGSWLSYAYGNESFSNWMHPEWVKFLFSTNNGLFPYGPVWFMVVLSLIWGSLKGNFSALLGLGLFIGITYLFSSWHIWFFGCGFGSRNFVEYSVLFALPFAQGLDVIWAHRGLWSKACLIAVLSLCCLVSLKLFHSYTKCFFGKDDWDWREYGYLLTRHVETFKNSAPIGISSGQEYVQLFRIQQKDKTMTYFREMKAELKWGKGQNSCDNLKLVLKSENGTDDPFYAEQVLCDEKGLKGDAYFGMWPQRSDSVSWVIYLWNPGGDELVLNDISLSFR